LPDIPDKVRILLELLPKIDRKNFTPALSSSLRKVVATDTLSNTAVHSNHARAFRTPSAEPFAPRSVCPIFS